MALNTYRPIYLNLLKIRMPLPAIASILHRLSGVAIFLLLPLLLFGLSESLVSKESFIKTSQCLTHGGVSFLVWVFLASLVYHTLAGVRHLLMDCNVGESLTAGRISASVVLVLTVILAAGLGVWLW